jgi:hypothetical protein
VFDFPDDRFRLLPEEVRDRMLETLRSDHPIAVGNWIIERDDKRCGCLLTDGLQADKSMFAALEALVFHPYNSSTAKGYRIRALVAQFYDLSDTVAPNLTRAAVGFDSWAERNGFIDQRQKEENESAQGLLSDAGRANVIQELEALRGG